MTRRWWVQRNDIHVEDVHGRLNGTQKEYYHEVVPAADYDRLWLKWASEKPTEPGWYWYRRDSADKPRCVELQTWPRPNKPDRLYVNGGVSVPMNALEFDGEWAGPLVQPEGGIMDRIGDRETTCSELLDKLKEMYNTMQYGHEIIADGDELRRLLVKHGVRFDRRTGEAK